MELVLTAFRSQITQAPNGQTLMKFFPLKRDENGAMVLDDSGNPIPEGTPVVLVWTREGIEAFKENLLGARGRIVMPTPGGPVENAIRGGNGT